MGGKKPKTKKPQTNNNKTTFFTIKKKNLKICWAFQNSCETCVCSGANQAGKMPLPKSPSYSGEQRSKEKKNTNLGKWINNLKNSFPSL